MRSRGLCLQLALHLARRSRQWIQYSMRFAGALTGAGAMC